MAFHGALGILGWVPDGGPAGGFASGPGRGGDSNPAGGRRAVGLGNNQLPEGVHIGKGMSVQAAKGFSHIHDAASSYGDYNGRGELLCGFIGFKQLLHRRIGSLKGEGEGLKAGFLVQKEGKCRIF